LEDLKKHNSEAMKATSHQESERDIKTANQDFKDADTAAGHRLQNLGASATKADVEAKVTEIRRQSTPTLNHDAQGHRCQGGCLCFVG